MSSNKFNSTNQSNIFEQAKNHKNYKHITNKTYYFNKQEHSKIDNTFNALNQIQSESNNDKKQMQNLERKEFNENLKKNIRINKTRSSNLRRNLYLAKLNSETSKNQIEKIINNIKSTEMCLKQSPLENYSLIHKNSKIINTVLNKYFESQKLNKNKMKKSLIIKV